MISEVPFGIVLLNSLSRDVAPFGARSCPGIIVMDGRAADGAAQFHRDGDVATAVVVDIVINPDFVAGLIVRWVFKDIAVVWVNHPPLTIYRDTDVVNAILLRRRATGGIWHEYGQGQASGSRRESCNQQDDAGTKSVHCRPALNG